MNDARKARILVIAPSAGEQAAVREALGPVRFALSAASTAAQARALLLAEPFELVIVSEELPDLAAEILVRELQERTERWLPSLVLARAERVARFLSLGADDAIAQPLVPELLRARVEARLRGHARVERTEAARAALEQLAMTDGLTGLFNHRQFQIRLADEFRRALRYEQPLALVVVDLDRFKQVNDTFGHLVGDAVLRHVSEVLRGQLRNTDILVRQGGEEFAAILPQTPRTGADLVARRLGSALEQSPYLDARTPPILLTASIGVSHAPASGMKTPEDLIAAADQAMYRAKRAGRNQVMFAPITTARPRSRGSRRIGSN